MPNENDVMIIVGSFTSANTCRMTELSRIRNERTYQVESADDLQESWFDGAELVGIHAGASTPDWIIKAVAEAICNYDAPEAASSSKTQDRATP